MASTQRDADPSSQDRSSIIQAATIVGVAFVFSRFLGLVRDAVINYYFGITSLEANAYFIASRFPETIFLIIAGGALGSAFIPTFSALFHSMTTATVAGDYFRRSSTWSRFLQP